MDKNQLLSSKCGLLLGSPTNFFSQDFENSQAFDSIKLETSNSNHQISNYSFHLLFNSSSSSCFIFFIQSAMNRSGKNVESKIERKIIEKDRRIMMKSLCFKLVSLIPNHHFKTPKVLIFFSNV